MGFSQQEIERSYSISGNNASAFGTEILLDDVLHFQIDEIHLLKEDRGAVLEVVIARMKLRARVRFVAVSATVPNIHDVSKWIGEGRSESGLSLCRSISRLKCQQPRWSLERNIDQ